ncbi:MAG TPA: ABC transporter substrate-binding protein [Mycobacteriales bacterium]|nr:ABC transporter substrate-binding protein [Mycobacteriales bacterium]
MDHLDMSRRRALQIFGAGSLIAAAGCSRHGGGKGGKGSATFASWYPFNAPPAGNFHTLGGIPTSIVDSIGYLGDYMVLPGGLYYWKDQKYFYLIADESSGLSSDGKTFTYKVRADMKWSDGNPITAKDVYTTWLCRYVVRSPVFDYVDSFEQTDDMTVAFHIKTPAPVAEYYLMREHIVPAATYGQFAKKAEPFAKNKTSPDDKSYVALSKQITSFRPTEIISSGPFKPDTSSVNDSQLTMMKNDKCYFADKVKFDKVIDYASFDWNSIVPIILQKKLSYTTGGPSPAVERRMIKAGLRIVRSPIYSGPALYFNYAKLPEFADKRSRQALCYAFDHAQNGKVSLGKSGKLIKLYAGISDVQVPTWLSEQDQAKLTKYTFDRDKATSLLQAAGWKKSGSSWVTPQGKKAAYDLLFPSDFGDWSSSASDFATQMGEFGIKITLHGEQSTQVQVDVKASKFTLAIQSWGSSANPFPSDSFRTALFNLNTPALGPTQKGMAFPMKQKTDVLGEVDLEKAVIDSGLGATPDALKEATTTVALAFNELLPVIPMWERYGNAPVLDSAVAGYPADGDPLYENSIYADNYTTFLTFQGKLHPA